MLALTIVLNVEEDGFSALRTAGVQGMPGDQAIAAGKLIHLGEGDTLEVGALAGGMQSGAPSCALCFNLPDGRAVLAETSLALFLTAGDALKARYGDPRAPSPLERETEKAHAAAQSAMDAQAAQGSTAEGVLEAGLRAALDHAIAGLPKDHAELEEALGVEVDPGALLIGGLVSTLTLQGVNSVEAARLAAPLLREYMDKAREACA